MDDRSDDKGGGTQVLPVLAEELALEKTREEIGALRVRIVAESTPQSLQGERRIERTLVQRVPRNVEVEAARAPWTEGETLVVPVYAEKVELRRRLILTEEVRIARRAEARPVEMQAETRRERAVVERLQGDGEWREVDVDEARRNHPHPERKEP